jgi:hypothetical protein
MRELIEDARGKRILRMPERNTLSVSPIHRTQAVRSGEPALRIIKGIFAPDLGAARAVAYRDDV